MRELELPKKKFRSEKDTKFRDEIFEILAISTEKPPTYIIKNLEKEKILAQFSEKELGKGSN